MTYSKKFIIAGLCINILASVMMLSSYLDTTKNINDDFILKMDREGNYTQEKHINDWRLGMVGLGLFVLGFIFQAAGTFIAS